MLNMNNFFKILAIIAGVFWWRHSPPFKNGNHSEPAKSVIVYDLHECGKSVRLMRELDAAGIPYEVRDLGNPLWKDALNGTGRTSFSPPVVDVGGTIIESATLREIKRAL